MTSTVFDFWYSDCSFSFSFILNWLVIFYTAPNILLSSVQSLFSSVFIIDQKEYSIDNTS